MTRGRQRAPHNSGLLLAPGQGWRSGPPPFVAEKGMAPAHSAFFWSGAAEPGR